LRVVAEGVVTAEQALHLAGMHCDEAQGYYYRRPVPAAQIESLLSTGCTLPETC
jgi:EAL domain-containing protein (putative c-di-GMP-specific phosphodiesterase class I)